MSVPEHAIHYLEIVTSDVAGTRASYEKVYGWKFQQIAELGGAWVAQTPGGGRCGIRAPLRDTEQPIVRPYLRVSNIEAAAKRVADSGGRIALEPTELGSHGKIVIYLLGGIEQGMWELP